MVHFHNNRSWYNPAFTGIRGSAMFSAKYKTQWQSARVKPFETKFFNYEESLACQNIYDYGIQLLQDEEGAGMLRTWMVGGKISASFLFFDDGYHSMTTRFGLNFQWGGKRLDFNKLSFADQLDFKYGLFDAFGNPNQTTFIIPEDAGTSRTFFAPALGFVNQHVVERNQNRQPYYITYGASLHNVLDLINPRQFGNDESLLGIGTTLASRYTLHAAVELYPFNRNRDIISLRPQVFFQRQEQLQYWETGLRAGWNNLTALSVFYHSSRWANPERTNTNWLSIAIEFNQILGELSDSQSRLDLGFSYSIGVSGLKNRVGPILEFGIAYHLSYSPMCSSRRNGKHDLRAGKNRHLCPKVSNSHRKLYENIWYKK